MGIDAAMESENGEQVECLDDSELRVEKLLEQAVIEKDLVCLPFIDPYGNTVFNRLQLPHLTKELELLLGKAQNTQVRKHGQRLLTRSSPRGAG